MNKLYWSSYFSVLYLGLFAAMISPVSVSELVKTSWSTKISYLFMLTIIIGVTVLSLFFYFKILPKIMQKIPPAKGKSVVYE
jgi:c-di-AMP phosphodiesterase-like protein